MSCVRCDTRYDMTPKRPTHASTRATAANDPSRNMLKRRGPTDSARIVVRRPDVRDRHTRIDASNRGPHCGRQRGRVGRGANGQNPRGHSNGRPVDDRSGIGFEREISDITGDANDGQARTTGAVPEEFPPDGIDAGPVAPSHLFADDRCRRAGGRRIAIVEVAPAQADAERREVAGGSRSANRRTARRRRHRRDVPR